MCCGCALSGDVLIAGARVVLFTFTHQERQMQEERQRQDEQDLDYLAPFIIQMGNIEKMTKWQALRLKEDCLTDFKYRLIDKANIIQLRFEKVFNPFLSLVQHWVRGCSTLYGDNTKGCLFIMTEGKKLCYSFL